MLCKYYWIVLYTVHFTAFCLGEPFFPGHGVYYYTPVDPEEYKERKYKVNKVEYKES